MYTIPAKMLDNALANVSDVPQVETQNGTTLSVTFSGNYEKPVHDLTEFLSRLQRFDAEAADAAREGLHWDDNHYGGHAIANLNGLRIEGKSDYEPCDECGEHGREGKHNLVWGDRFLCADCREEEEV